MELLQGSFDEYEGDTMSNINFPVLLGGEGNGGVK